MTLETLRPGEPDFDCGHRESLRLGWPFIGGLAIVLLIAICALGLVGLYFDRLTPADQPAPSLGLRGTVDPHRSWLEGKVRTERDLASLEQSGQRP